MTLSLADLVYLDPVEQKDLISWRGAVGRLDALPEKLLLEFHNTFLPAAQNHPLTALRHEVEKALQEDPQANRRCLTLLGAVLDGAIAVFVVSKCGLHAYEVARDVWRGASVAVANPLTMALTGRFVVLTDLRPRCAFDVELAGSPLFVREAEFYKLVNAGSPASLKRLARSIIDRFLEQRPGQIMPKEDFRIEMRKLVPRATQAALDGARTAAMPEWKHHKGGRPRR